MTQAKKQGDDYYGYNMPFIGGTQNILSKQVGLRLIKNDILQLLLTTPGERVHRPTFGTSIKSTVFEQADDFTLSMLEDDIRTVMDREEPRVVVTDVNVVKEKDGHTIHILVAGYLTNNPMVKLEVETKVGTYV